MKLIAFCEAPADFRMLSGLVDRVLRDHVAEYGPAWILDQLDTPELVGAWHPDETGAPYFDLHRLKRLRRSAARSKSTGAASPRSL